MDTALSGWTSLPIELRQQVLTHTLNNAISARHSDPAKELRKAITPLIHTSHELAQDLLYPLTKLLSTITKTMHELQLAMRRLVQEGNMFGRIITGNPWWMTWCHMDKSWYRCAQAGCICACVEPIKDTYRSILRELMRLKSCVVVIYTALAMMRE